MKVKTHQIIAKRAYELVSAYLPITFDEKIMYLGARMPDLAPHRRFKAHNIRIAVKEEHFFKTLVHKKWHLEWLVAYSSGIMSHYMSDTFCYAHNMQNISVIQHRKYEVVMQHYSEKHVQKIESEKILQKWQELRHKGFEDYLKTENISYHVDMGKCHTLDECIALDLTRAIINSAVWMLEIAYIRHPEFIKKVLENHSNLDTLTDL